MLHDIILNAKSLKLELSTRGGNKMNEQEQENSTELTELKKQDSNEGGNEMAGKKPGMKGRKRKETQTTTATTEKQKPDKPKEKKVPLKVKAPKGVDVKETKYVITATKDEKRMWMRGSSVGLTHKVSGLKGFKQISVEDAKKNHLGKTRMIGKVATQEELDELLTKFFE